MKYYLHIHMLVTGDGLDKLSNWGDSELVVVDVIKTRFKNRLLNEIKELRINFYAKYECLSNYDNYIKYLSDIMNDEFICYKKKPYDTVYVLQMIE